MVFYGKLNLACQARMFVVKNGTQSVTAAIIEECNLVTRPKFLTIYNLQRDFQGKEM